jgi:hypothetical protein
MFSLHHPACTYLPVCPPLETTMEKHVVGLKIRQRDDWPSMMALIISDSFIRSLISQQHLTTPAFQPVNKGLLDWPQILQDDKIYYRITLFHKLSSLPSSTKTIISCSVICSTLLLLHSHTIVSSSVSIDLSNILPLYHYSWVYFEIYQNMLRSDYLVGNLSIAH